MRVDILLQIYPLAFSLCALGPDSNQFRQRIDGTQFFVKDASERAKKCNQIALLI
jgi:hypothetical protein